MSVRPTRGEGEQNPDPRIERSRRVIQEATVDELAGVGYGGLRIESIARRAGVGKATIYRHWNGKQDLVESTLAMIKEDMVAPGEGTVRERVTSILTWLASYLTDSRASSVMPALVSAAQFDKSVAQFHFRFTSERRQAMIDLLSEGVQTGELRSDLDAELAAEMLAGVLFYRRLMTDRPFPSEEVGNLVATVLGSADRADALTI